MSMIMCRTREALRRMAFRVHRLEYTVGAVQDAVDSLVAQLGKAKLEILGKLDELQAVIDAGETPDLTALTDAVQALDDVVPDAPVEWCGSISFDDVVKVVAAQRNSKPLSHTMIRVRGIA